ncbi:MAG: DNA-3-methyladenine glycosylase family protein [Bosea sp. (in: a-proteobacteria)]
MTSSSRTRLIESEADLDEGLAALCSDPRWREASRVAGPLPLRRSDGGFRGLANIIVAQQLSVASANAIWARVEAQFVPLEPRSFVAADEDTYRAAGLSRPKQRTLRVLAEAFHKGQLTERNISDGSPEEISARLTALSGIGPWTADIYLMFCLGHADAFAPGDLALQEAAKIAFGLENRPKADELAEMAKDWSPWRGVAARLLWAYYRVVKSREGAPV